MLSALLVTQAIAFAKDIHAYSHFLLIVYMVDTYVTLLLTWLLRTIVHWCNKHKQLAAAHGVGHSDLETTPLALKGGNAHVPQVQDAKQDAQ